jgi:chitinase
LRRFKDFRLVNPQIKLLLGLGGPDQGKSVFHNLAGKSTQMWQYAMNVKSLVDEYELDGIDFDWDYPGYQPENIEADRVFYIQYLELFRQQLGDSKLITVSVLAKPEDIQRSYNVTEMIRTVDFINLKTYNLRGTSASEQVTAFHSPLYSRSTEVAPNNEWNVESIVANWNAEANTDISEMLVIGVATFGRSFKLVSNSDTSVGAPVTGLGSRGVILPSIAAYNGFLGYREICRGIVNDPTNWIENWDNEQVSAFGTFNSNEWVGFDSIRSAVGKIVFARDNNLGGVNYIRLELEDFGKYQ